MKKRISLLACLFFVTAQGPAQPQPRRADAFPRYQLEIKLDPDRHSLEGRGDLLIPASKEPRDFIRLGLGKNMRDLVVEVTEPEECAGAVALEKGFPLGNNNGWVVRPAKPFPAGRPARLRFAWRGGEKSSFVFYLGPEGSFASGINTAWYPVLDDGLAVGALRIAVPEGLTVHANGSQRGTPEERARGVFSYESAAPLNWRQEGETVRGEITQSQPYYRATLEVQAESSDGRKQSLMVEVDGAKTEFTLPVKFAAQTVALDPHFQVLRWTPEYRAAVSERTPSNDK